MSNVNVIGTASIQYLNVVFESSSVIYASGSNILGDATNDVQTFWGTVNVISGPFVVTGSANFKETITGSVSTALNANTASYHGVAFVSASQVGGNNKVSLTTQAGNTTTLTIDNVSNANSAASATTAISASYATTAGTVSSTVTSASYAYTASSAVNSLSASYSYTASSAVQATSASFSLRGQGAFTGSFSGSVSASFSGSGVGIFGIVSSSYAYTASSAINAATASYFNGLVASASYAILAENANNAYTANVANSAISAQTASYLVGGAATLSANTFNGNQTIANGYELLTNQMQATVSAGLMVSSSGNLGVARFGNGGGQQAEFFGQVSAVQFSGSGANVYGVVSSSYAYTASSAISAGTASYAKNFIISGSQVITGSLVGQPVSQSVSSLTASLNLQAGNFFNLTLPASVNTYITASGQVAGQTINLKITQQATTGSVSLGAGFKQVSGSAYTVTAAASAVDIVTFISFDNTGLYVSNVKNLV